MHEKDGRGKQPGAPNSLEQRSPKNPSEAASELAQREQEAWLNVVGVRVEVKPLPDNVTPEVRSNLDQWGFGLRYIPALGLGNRGHLKRLGVDTYLAVLQNRYPNWKRFESLNYTERADYRNSRNLEREYWEAVEGSNVDFPVLPGQWMAVETVDKPKQHSSYPETRLAEKLGFREGRFNLSWNEVHKAIKREKQNILSEIGLTGGKEDVRLLEALEWNLLGNPEGWGETDTYEWTNTKYRASGDSLRLVVGLRGLGGAAEVYPENPGIRSPLVGFRTVIVLGS